jgi:hypothetical protein
MQKIIPQLKTDESQKLLGVMKNPIGNQQDEIDRLNVETQETTIKRMCGGRLLVEHTSVNPRPENFWHLTENRSIFWFSPEMGHFLDFSVTPKSGLFQKRSFRKIPELNNLIVQNLL